MRVCVCGLRTERVCGPRTGGEIIEKTLKDPRENTIKNTTILPVVEPVERFFLHDGVICRINLLTLKCAILLTS